MKVYVVQDENGTQAVYFQEKNAAKFISSSDSRRCSFQEFDVDDVESDYFTIKKEYITLSKRTY